jgi:hypothetical protein
MITLKMPDHSFATTKKISCTACCQSVRKKSAAHKNLVKTTIQKNIATQNHSIQPNRTELHTSYDKVDSLIRYIAAVSLTVYVAILVYLPMDFILQARQVLKKQ